MSYRALLTGAAVAFVLTGCAAGGGSSQFYVEFDPQDFMVRQSVPQPPEAVWDAVVLAYESLELPRGRSNSRREREYSTPYLRANGPIYGERRSTFFSCGAGPGIPIADQSIITFAVRTWVEPNGEGGTNVYTQTRGHARRLEGGATTIECGSTGLLERMIFEETLAVLAATPTAAR